MNRTIVGWILVLSGWFFYHVSLGCPAIEYRITGLDGSISGTKFGANCLWDTLVPINWVFAPFLFLYALANVVILSSALLVVASSTTRHTGALILLLCFGLTLYAPWCAQEVQGIRFGCVFWMLSYLNVGLGLLFLPTMGSGWQRRREPDCYA